MTRPVPQIIPLHAPPTPIFIITLHTIRYGRAAEPALVILEIAGRVALQTDGTVLAVLTIVNC